MALGLDGVDVYALNVWQNGPLAKAIARGKLPAAAALRRSGPLYDDAASRLVDAGWRQLSQAHFGRTMVERNRYNRLVKDGAVCLAFGAGAGGSAHGLSWRTLPALDHRDAAIADGRWPIAGIARLPADHAARTRVITSLDLGRLDLAALEREAPGVRAAADAPPCQLVRSGADQGRGRGDDHHPRRGVLVGQSHLGPARRAGRGGRGAHHPRGLTGSNQGTEQCIRLQ